MRLAITFPVAMAIFGTAVGCSHTFEEPAARVADAGQDAQSEDGPFMMIEAGTGAAPGGCQFDFGFESGSAAGWSIVKIDGDMSEPAISSRLARSGTRSLMTSLSDSTRFGHFRLLLEICPGSTFDLGDRLFSLWIQFDGLPSAPPDAYSGCEAGIVTPEGTDIGVSARLLWPATGWQRIQSTKGWPIIRKLSLYCVVSSPSGGGRVHIDDLRIE
jgi:hypothetical protein